MITVLTAAYNGEMYIREQMDSILGQTCEGIRIVVSDDCSSDKTPDILAEYVEKYPDRVAVIRRREPSGGAARHFLGLLSMMARMGRGDEEKMGAALIPELCPDAAGQLRDMARSAYFMLSDQDDVWLPDKAQTLLLRMEEMEQTVGREMPILVHSDLKVVDRELNCISPSFFQYQKISPERTSLPQLLVQNNVTGGAVLFNRPLLALLERSPGSCLMHDSWLALVAACFGRIGWVDQPLYLYRQHGDNALGAEKGDNLEGAGQRLKDGAGARENYRKMFGQAASLLEVYSDRLSENQKKILTEFTKIPRRSRLGKMYAILRYGFTKNTRLRTLGQLLFIGD